MRMQRKFLSTVAALAIGAAGLSAAEAALDAAQVIAARQQDLKSLNKNFKALNEELRKSSPDKAVILDSAQAMEKLAAALPSWFPAGTGPETGLKTSAKAEIWTRPADFTRVAEGLSTESHKLAELAVAGDMTAVVAQAKKAGAACGACHEDFRVKHD